VFLPASAGVDACAQAGKLQEAEKLINWALGNKIPPGLGSYNRLLASYAEMGDMQGARKVYLRLKERYMPDIFTWNTLVAGYARAGDIARVRAVVEDAKRNGCQPDAWTWASLVNVSAAQLSCITFLASSR
jgi:pentatricopeptide repeat protein